MTALALLFFLLISLAVAGILVRPVLKTEGERPLAVALLAGLPLLAFGIYLSLGQPGLPGRPRTAEELNAARVVNNALLAQRPIEILKTVDSHDLGALMVLGELSHRFGHKKDTINFYTQALDTASALNDPHAVPIAETLGQAQVEFNDGRMGADARQTFEFLLAVDPQNPIALRYVRGYSVPHAAPQHQPVKRPTH